jgi:hypothetical protein
LLSRTSGTAPALAIINGADTNQGGKMAKNLSFNELVVGGCAAALRADSPDFFGIAMDCLAANNMLYPPMHVDSEYIDRLIDAIRNLYNKKTAA